MSSERRRDIVTAIVFFLRERKRPAPGEESEEAI